jgi:hypothetical protein
MVGTNAIVSRLLRARETQARSGANLRSTCGCACFLASDFGFSDMVQVNR